MTTTPISPPPGFRGGFRTDAEALDPLARASGPFRLPPAAAARPADAADVARLVSWADAEGLSLVPRGAGTGMPGHNVGRSVLVELADLGPAIGEVDREARTVRVAPGAVAARVDEAAARSGLTFPPLPSSADRATLGGMIANNAAGARSFRYGSVARWIDELEVVGADGAVRRLGPGRELPPELAALRRDLRSRLGDTPAGWPDVRKNSSGYALDRFLPSGDGADLVAGSEGTLAIVTAATLRLAERPAARAVVLLGVPDLGEVPGAAEVAEEVGASACEYLGRRILDMARLDEDEEVGSLSRGSDALLLVELEGSRADELAPGLGRLRELAGGLGGGVVAARDERSRDRLWDIRHRASPTIAEAAERGLVSTQFIEDSVVPRGRLPDYVRGLREILSDADTDAVIFGHAGDGNLHVNPLVDVGRRDWRARVRTILDETAELVAGLGGTLSGEHGDGRVRAPYLERIWGPELAGAFRAVKERLDPGGILNPGVVVPLPGQDPLEGLLAETASGGTGTGAR